MSGERYDAIVIGSGFGGSMAAHVLVHAGLRVLGFSIVTDLCLPDALEPVRIEEILAVAREAESKLRRLVTGLLARLD